MKKLIIAIMFLPLMGVGQYHGSNNIDSVKLKICKERGHVCAGAFSSTLAYCPPYLVETDSTSVMVYPACNAISYGCARCGKAVSEMEKEKRVVIWRKKDKKINNENQVENKLNK